MNIKKTILLIFLCAIVAAGIFFGLQKFNQDKKTLSINVLELNADSVRENQENIEEKKPENDNQIGSPPDENAVVADDKEIQPAEKKEEPKKVVEPEKNVQEKSSAGKIVDRLVSWGYTKSSGRKIDTIIVHTSYDSLGKDPYSISGIIDIYKQYEVSAHYLIARDGTAYRLVEDKNISWHAGASEVPDGRKNVNDFSIGIEVVNTKEGKFTDAQYDALNSLIAALKKNNSIKYVLGHDDIAPGRKSDPWGIEWNRVNK